VVAGSDPATHYAGPPRKVIADEGGPGEPGGRARPDPPVKKGKGPPPPSPRAARVSGGPLRHRRGGRWRQKVLRWLGLGARSVARAGVDASEQRRFFFVGDRSVRSVLELSSVCKNSIRVPSHWSIAACHPVLGKLKFQFRRSSGRVSKLVVSRRSCRDHT